MAQVPIPIQEQVELFRILSPAQQQALIRELQSQLPPAQRDAIIGALLQQNRSQPASTAAEDFDASGFASEIVAGLEVTELPGVLGPGDTLVIEFDFGDPAQANASTIEQAEFLERLQDGNPYQLDDDGRLLLPGVPSIALSGLNVEEATIRLSSERELRPFVLTLTYLPLAPVGTAALAPYGYDIFRNPPTTFASATDIPVPVGYVVGPGDTINIQLFGNQNQQYFLEVGRDGTINFPEIGPLNVSGLTFDALRNLIDENELMAHCYASLYDLPVTGLRFFTVYGPFGRPDMALFKFTKAILAGEPIDVFNYGHHRRDFTYIDDIVAGIVGACDRVARPNPDWDGHDPDPATSKAPYRIYNIGNQQPIELMRYIEVLEECLGREAEKNLLPLQAGDVPDTWADVEALVEDVGYRPATPIAQGFRSGCCLGH